ncbi:acetolactate decarboxylase [Agreia bicolorata]|uniref:Alpha-acetolactate decarboxylase n=1 Tax=Agreia bicolorata TaxID=110935 RepID=A0A1T4Y9J3_9MICO|nr:acetolactate decarboxylase [Agreia bicolorata]SKA98426.1 acetolactate decarboxylase [Agreia bicolorata]
MPDGHTERVDDRRRTVFQTSLMSALLDGVYDGDLTVGELLEHGDFGLGTFNALDGEMLVLDGVCHRLRADGSVERASKDDLTPFAVVMPFEPVTGFDITTRMSRADVVARIIELEDSQNYLFAVRVRGRFESVVTRTVRRQEKPYPPMREAVKDEAIVTFESISGTVAGFRTPLYERGIGVPGGHVHFIDDELSTGGHVLDFVLEHGRVDICKGSDLQLRLPLSTTFGEADLDPADLDDQVRNAENRSPR